MFIINSINCKEESNSTCEKLKELLNTKEYLDVGLGVQNHLGVKRYIFDDALNTLELEGYHVFLIPISKITTRVTKHTLVLVKPGVMVDDVIKNKDKIESIVK